MDIGIAKTLEKLQTQLNLDVRVHLSRNPFLKDPTARALEVFNYENLTQTKERNSILIYLNLKLRNFCLLSDTGLHKKLGQKYWDELGAQFREDLLSTHYENAVVILLFTLMDRLKKVYPKTISS